MLNPFKAQYVADGINKDFVFNFDIPQDRNLIVYDTLSGNAADEVADEVTESSYVIILDAPTEPVSTGTVRFNTAPLDQSIITITPDQETLVSYTFSNTVPFSTDNLNGAFDQESQTNSYNLQNYLINTIRYNLNENDANINYDNKIPPLDGNAFWRREGLEIISQDYDGFVQEVSSDIAPFISVQTAASANNANLSAEICCATTTWSGNVENVNPVTGDIITGPAISGFSSKYYWEQVRAAAAGLAGIHYNSYSEMLLNSGGDISAPDQHAISGGTTWKIIDSLTTSPISNTSPQLYAKSITPLNIFDFGAVGDGVTDDTQAWLDVRNLGGSIYFPKSTYIISSMSIPEDTTVFGDGIGMTKIHLKQIGVSPVVKGALNNGSIIKDIEFDALSEELPNTRFEITNNNTVVDRCAFLNFVDTVSSNAWGLYISGANNTSVLNCAFDGNTQSDIAIVDDNASVYILAPYSISDKLHINMEPNGVNFSSNITIENAKMDKLSLLTNTFQWDTLNPIRIVNSRTREFNYDGADVSFDGFSFSSIKFDSSIAQMGSISNVNGFGIGANLLLDSRVRILTDDSATSNWSLRAQANIAPADYWIKIENPFGRGVRLNPTQTSGFIQIEQSFPVSQFVIYMFAITAKAFSSDVGADFRGRIGDVRWFDNGMNVLRTDELGGARLNAAQSGTNEVVKTQMVMIDAPINATSCSFTIKTSSYQTTLGLDLFGASAHEVLRYNYSQQFNGVIHESHSFENGASIIYGALGWNLNGHYAQTMKNGDTITVPSEGTTYTCIDDTIFSGPHWIGRWSISSNSYRVGTVPPNGSLVPYGESGDKYLNVSSHAWYISFGTTITSWSKMT